MVYGKSIRMLAKIFPMYLLIVSQVAFSSIDYIDTSIWQEDSGFYIVNGEGLIKRQPLIIQVAHPKGTEVDIDLSRTYDKAMTKEELNISPVFLVEFEDEAKRISTNNQHQGVHTKALPHAQISSLMVTSEDIQKIGDVGYFNIRIPNNPSLSASYQYRLKGYSSCDNSKLIGRDISHFNSTQDVLDYVGKWLEFEQCYNTHFSQDDLTGMFFNLQAGSCAPKVYTVFNNTSLIS